MAAPERPTRLRLPSLGEALGAASATLRRFPLALAAAALGALAAILTSESLGPGWLHEAMLAAATLGIPLLVAVALLGERLRSGVTRVAISIGAVALLVGVHQSWDGWSEHVRFERFVQLAVAFHLLVAFVPFVRRDRPRAFWQYNRLLFQRFVVAGISSGTLFLGLALAFAALDKLFGVDVPNQAYLRLWVLCAYVFNTWFFLGGVPSDLDALESSSEYPAVLRVFAQYTLVPLVTVYLVILTLYFGKVLATRVWPSGWIGYLVSGVGASGIFALLLVHPLAEREDQRWVRVFARDFWLGILPAVVMLWLAIYQRVHPYGFTEPRYFLLVLSLWLGGMAVYYVATRSRRIIVIPASLCALAVVTFAGPWGAFAVSRRSQIGRVRDLLAAHGALVGGKARRVATDLSVEDRKALSGAVRYLIETHGARSLAPLLGDSFATSVLVHVERNPAGVDQGARWIVGALGVTYVDQWTSGTGAAPWFQYSAQQSSAVPIAGYELLLLIRGAPPRAAAPDTALVAYLVPEARSVRIARSGRALLDVPLDSVLARARGSVGNVLPEAKLRFEASNGEARALVLLRSVNGYRRPGVPDIREVSGVVLLTLRSAR